MCFAKCAATKFGQTNRFGSNTHQSNAGYALGALKRISALRIQRDGWEDAIRQMTILAFTSGEMGRLIR